MRNSDINEWFSCYWEKLLFFDNKIGNNTLQNFSWTGSICLFIFSWLQTRFILFFACVIMSADVRVPSCVAGRNFRTPHAGRWLSSFLCKCPGAMNGYHRTVTGAHTAKWKCCWRADIAITISTEWLDFLTACVSDFDWLSDFDSANHWILGWSNPPANRPCLSVKNSSFFDGRWGLSNTPKLSRTD